jgi:hypothetical protein
MEAAPQKTIDVAEKHGVVYKGTPIFQPIAHPVLTQLGQVNIRKFTKARDAYVRAIEERTIQDGTGRVTPISLGSPLNPTYCSV